jgi:hypothetical protein
MKPRRLSQTADLMNGARCLAWALSLLMLEFAGPRAVAQVENGYGRSHGTGYRYSINGTSTFTSMFEAAGRSVTTKSYIPSQLDRFDTIVWFPDRQQVPSAAVITHLDEWMQRGYGRTVIYVGRSYSADADYWAAVATRASAAERRSFRRQQSIAQAESHQWFYFPQSACDWFSLTLNRESPVGQVYEIGSNGRKRQSLTTARFGDLILSPSNPPINNMLESRNLVVIHGEPFAFRLVDDRCDGQVIVINNGSTLLNFPLTQDANRQWASQLIDETIGEVLFLESGETDPIIGGTPTATSWSWVGQPPIRYIAPQVILVGVVAVACLYPILGRPRRVEPPILNRFRRHIEEIANLLRRSNDTSQAMDVISEYRKIERRESSGSA